MTVGDLIRKLQAFDADTPVVIKDNQRNALPSDYVELMPQSLKVLEAKPLFKNTIAYGRQVYDGSLSNSKDKTKVLSLTGHPWGKK